MRICLIGKNLANLVLANVLAKKKINVDIAYDFEDKKKNTIRTLGISKSNFNYLNNIKKNSNLVAWPVEKIKIFYESINPKELFEFINEEKKIFFLVKYNQIYNFFEKSLKKSKKTKFLKLKKITQDYFINNHKYNLIINSDTNNEISKKFLFNKIDKSYDSFAYTGLINHKKKENNIASQIFTKFGPLAFLPLSPTKTSIVFSLYNKNIKDKKQLIKLINKFNLNYKIKSFGKFEKFNLKFSMLRNYNYKNILFFGDLLHRIHPLAGQGFNMTIRDIQILSSLINKKIKLGLELDISIINDFEKKTKHKNYIFGSGIDFINSFFEIDSRINNLFSKSILKVLKKNKFLNRYATLFADKGLNI